MKRFIVFCLIVCILLGGMPGAYASDEPEAAAAVPETETAPPETVPEPAPESPGPVPEETPEKTEEAPETAPPEETAEPQETPEPEPKPEETPEPEQSPDPENEASGEPVSVETPAAPEQTGAPAVAAAAREEAHPVGTAPETLEHDDVSGSVAEAGYFPSRDTVLQRRYSGVFLASMILWHRDNGAACCRIKDTTVFADVLGGSPSYTPRPGDLVFYQNSAYNYEHGILEDHDFHHTGIVSETGPDYIRTIEGNTGQTVSEFTWSARSCSGDICRAWIVDVFGDDDGARTAFAETARQAREDALADRKAGRCGFGSWCESRAGGDGRNDTIASGYFGMAEPWCEMFVLWCAFHAQLPRDGLLTLYTEKAEASPVTYVITSGGSPVTAVEAGEDGTAQVRLAVGEYEITAVPADVRLRAESRSVCLDRFGAEIGFTLLPVPARAVPPRLPGGMDLA